ncbi:MAG: Fic family protein [Acidobacteria bacterium]|nr:Fic family protein [Acidobacteriota bacterium]
MKATDFEGSYPGRLVPTIEGALAFAPNPLPPALPVNWEMSRTLSEADRRLGELAGVARNLPNPHLLIGPFARREAVLSSRIEGTQTSLSELLLFEAANPTREATGDVREVANYVHAMDHGIRRLEQLPVSLRLMRELHGLLMRGVRGAERTPGEFRRVQNWIGPAGIPIANATFVPPPVSEMNQALMELEIYLHAPSDLPPLVRLGLIHYQFEAIHPFVDGNGRIGRLLVTLLLCSENLLPQPLLYLSAFLERNRTDYYRLLREVSRAGNWMDWTSFFLRGIGEQASDAVERSHRLLDLWQRYRRELQSARHTGTLVQLVDMLFESPFVTPAGVSSRLKVSWPTAQNQILRLAEMNILHEATGRRRNRVFVAQEILDLIQRETAAAESAP